MPVTFPRVNIKLTSPTVGSGLRFKDEKESLM